MLNGPDAWQHNPPGDSDYDRWLEDNEAGLIEEWLGVVDPWKCSEFIKFVEAKWGSAEQDAKENDADFRNDIANDA